MKPNILFVGGGNMAQALIGGLLKQGHQPNAIQVIEIQPLLCEQFTKQGIYADKTLSKPFTADIAILAVKPQQMQDALANISPNLKASLIISIAAGITIQTLSQWLGGHQRIVRCMPNTPALVNTGMTGIYANPACSTADRQAAENILKCSGEVLWCQTETMLNPITAISGSGPGYVFLFMQALEKAAILMGFDVIEARQLVNQTFLGAAKLAQHSSESLATLRQQVTSKGGTTAAGLNVMDTQGVEQAIIAGAQAALNRAIELGKEKN